MPNRLAQSHSPYLLQHAHNPVDWYPWGDEALDRSRAEERPIFLSIGYSACHWCHVMERESFENTEIAARLNANFVCIKVDREERPDLDQIYMTAVQLLTGRGGWPMSVFLTPQLQPFFGGTYWPPQSRQGMPGFDQVLGAVHNAWVERRDQVVTQAAMITERITEAQRIAPGEQEPHRHSLLDAARRLEQAFDTTFGGFGQAPKFPHAMDLQLLLRVWHRTGKSGLLDMVRLTLDKMAQGGIHDHLGGGFARYSVDERWLVPHFEKMLYDNALLLGLYVDAFTATGETRYTEVARGIADYALTTMAHPAGGFYSAEDADSEGVEGKFYVWRLEEVQGLLDEPLVTRFCEVYDISAEGNFEEANILNTPKTIEQVAALRGWDLEELRADLRRGREILLHARCQRVRPGLDDKVLLSWNALMIDALARCGAVLEEPRYLEAAKRCAAFLLTEMRRKDGRLWHMWRNGAASGTAFLDDYAYLASALVSLYESTFEERWIEESLTLVGMLRRDFADPEGAGFYFTPHSHESLISRTKDLFDNSVPSGNGMAATALVRLGRLCGRIDFVEAARDILVLASGLMEQSPTAAGQLLIALDYLVGPTTEIVILGAAGDAATAQSIHGLRTKYIPNKVVAFREKVDHPESSHALDPIFLGRRPGLVPPTVYLCEKFVCQSPLQGRKATQEAWNRLAAAGDK